MSPIGPSGKSGGGSQTVVLPPQTVTTNPASFDVYPLFDAGGPALVAIKATLQSFVANGETFGEANGDIAGDLANYTVGPTSGSAATPAWWLTDVNGWDANTLMSTVGQYIGVVVPTPRYALAWLQLFWAASLTIYNGANHPTATFLVEATATPFFP